MQTTVDVASEIAIARQRRGAARFFWLWLVTATAMSVTGNVAHAVLHADSRTLALAAGAALVPPVVLLAATHSVALLVRTRAGGMTYWCALVMTLALAACAFVLSFDALRSLAVTLGLPAGIAWLWPCAIDVAIAQATLCLLSLSRHDVAGSVTNAASETVSPSALPPIARQQVASVAERQPKSARQEPSTRAPAKARAEPAATPAPVASADIERWRPVAESIVREGVTSKPPRLVATILALREAGVSPYNIGRDHNVHHTTVGRIISAAEALTA